MWPHSMLLPGSKQPKYLRTFICKIQHMCWSLLFKIYRNNFHVPTFFIFLHKFGYMIRYTGAHEINSTAQQTLAVAMSPVIFSKYSVLSLSLNSYNAISNLGSWHHLDQLHLHALSHTWQRAIIFILKLWMKWDGNHINYKGSALSQRTFKVKFPDFKTFWPQKEWTI